MDEELADEFINAGWLEVDLNDAFDRIEDVFGYFDENGSL